MIELRNIGKSYDDITALAEISVTVPDAGVLTVLGPSGCGKTTLLRIIAGLEQPDTGEVQIDRRPVSSPGLFVHPHERNVGFVFQQPALWPHMTVRAHIMFGLTGLTKNEARDRLAWTVKHTQIAGLEDRRPDQLSGGEARRVAIARSLSTRPRHLLIDEALVNLDEQTRDTLLDMILTNTTEEGQTLIYVTHDGRELNRLTGNILDLTRKDEDPSR